MTSEKSQKTSTIQRSNSNSSRSNTNSMEYGKLSEAGPQHVLNNGYGQAVAQSMSFYSPNVQLKKDDQEEDIQLKHQGGSLVENNTGMPDHLKSGVENLSGISMEDVNVHYNSEKPAQLQAHAYAQGTDIHVAPGQEKHLPHEAWHVVQQKQGRVQPTMQMKGKVNVNDDKGLEHEADVMGRKAIQFSGNSQQTVQRYEGNSDSKVVQRNERSAEVLGGKKMAEPKVGVQDIELAKSIQDDLEKVYQDVMDIDHMGTMDSANYNSAVCLGGIILPPLNGFNNLQDLIESCRFVNLGKGSVTRGIYELLNEELKRKIIVNTLSTMEKASQVEYLQASNFATDEESGWKVVVEVHYYRTRPTTNNVFHKDTLGTTLFVNLNYLNQERMVGPEFVINPMDNEKHMSDIAQSLPEEFLQDRQTVMDQLDEPQIIEVVEVPEYGFVAFVDEMINHSSPTTEHRKVKGSDVHRFLRERDNDAYNKYKGAYDKWSGRWNIFWSYESYLPDGGGFDGEDWLSVFEEIRDENAMFNRQELRAMDVEQRVLSDAEIEMLIHIAEHGSFGSVSIPKAGGRSNMTSDDRPMKRRMSMDLDQQGGGNLSKESGGKRSFFRTWVRAERVETEVVKPNWKWDQKR
ncbi:MAG: DUF4157 domain-containing protein [Sporocytophaga sp.]|nr:DUF4157 domain-containing protein [Sporocytophaga sp.]